jgi:hypothetical protein
MPETLRGAITSFCDNSEEWFSGKDILLFVKQIRDILSTHPAEEDSAAAEAIVGAALSSMMLTTEKAAGSLKATVAELDQAIQRAKDTLASL